jgi:hypothetical protein
MGLVNFDGEEIIPFGRYDEIHAAHDGFAIVESNGRLGVINTRHINNE